MSRWICKGACSAGGIGAIFNRTTLCVAAVLIAALGFLLPPLGDAAASTEAEAQSDERANPATTGRAENAPTDAADAQDSTLAHGPAHQTQRIAKGDAFRVTGRWALSQGVLGAEGPSKNYSGLRRSSPPLAAFVGRHNARIAGRSSCLARSDDASAKTWSNFPTAPQPTVRTEVEVRYRVEVLRRRGETLRIRVTTLAHRERTLGSAEPARSVPLPKPRVLTCRADRLALVGAPYPSRALGLPLPQGKLVDDASWERRGQVTLLGVPVPTLERLTSRRQGADVHIDLRGAGQAALADTGITIRVEIAGSSRFDPQSPAWPRSVECSYLWQVTGGGGDDAASSLHVKLTCERERA